MTQSRKVCRSMAQSLAASPRAYPSSTNASPNIRRAALASLLHAAACRKSVAVRSARIIVNAFGIEPSANHDQPAENHISACLRRPAESKVNAAGISALIVIVALDLGAFRRQMKLGFDACDHCWRQELAIGVQDEFYRSHTQIAAKNLTAPA